MRHGQYPAVDRKQKFSRELWREKLKAFFNHGLVPSLVVFPEGTRSISSKNHRSRYVHLLNPQITGLEDIVSQYERIMDVTLIYDGGITSWDLIFGRIKKITLVIRDISGRIDVSSRRSLHDSMNQIWAEKDACISAYKKRAVE